MSDTYRRRPGRPRRAPVASRPCPHCGTEFTPERDRTKHCSNLCANRQTGQRLRAAAKERGPNPAKCHPERRHMAFGLCRACYRTTDEGRVRATCHPARKHFAKGLCNPCYDLDYTVRTVDKRRAYSLRKKFNISAEDYEAALALQDGRCLICHRLSQKMRLAVDHDPYIEKLTGIVVPRALLCVFCNKNVVGALERYAAGNWLDGMGGYVERTRELREIYLEGGKKESIGFTPTKNYKPESEIANA